MGIGNDNIVTFLFVKRNPGKKVTVIILVIERNEKGIVSSALK